MKIFVIHLNGGDSTMVEASTAREAARIARRWGRNILKENDINTTYFVWNENETEILYMVSTVKVGNRMVSEIINQQH